MATAETARQRDATDGVVELAREPGGRPPFWLEVAKWWEPPLDWNQANRFLIPAILKSALAGAPWKDRIFLNGMMVNNFRQRLTASI